MKANLERKGYFIDPRFSRSDIELLFSRTRMVDVKKNFANEYG